MNELTNILPSAGQLSKTGWSLPDNLTETDWKLAGTSIARVEGALMWWLGDWWNFGGHKYGDRKALVESEEWDGPAYQTCKDAAWVCSVFEKSFRNDLLSFTHHKATASLPIEEAVKVLHWAEKNNATVKATQEKVKNIKAWLAQGWTTDQLERKARVEQGYAVVASQRKDETGKERDAALMAWADQQGLLQKIDRNTDWGNPFEMPVDGDRDTVCDNYSEFYLPHKPGLLKRIPSLKGKVLVCWCYPDRCHGAHLAGLANPINDN